MVELRHGHSAVPPEAAKIISLDCTSCGINDWNSGLKKTPQGFAGTWITGHFGHPRDPGDTLPLLLTSISVRPSVLVRPCRFRWPGRIRRDGWRLMIQLFKFPSHQTLLGSCTGTQTPPSSSAPIRGRQRDGMICDKGCCCCREEELGDVTTFTLYLHRLARRRMLCKHDQLCIKDGWNEDGRMCA